jgi:hypothetical protein
MRNSVVATIVFGMAKSITQVELADDDADFAFLQEPLVTGS